MSRERKIFSVMEYHRGEWIQVFVKDAKEKTPKRVKISIEHAEMMNLDAEAQVKEKNRTSLFKYIEIKDSSNKKDILDNDGNVLTDPKKMKRPQMIQYCVNNEIPVVNTDKNVDLIAKIENFNSNIQ